MGIATLTALYAYLVSINLCTVVAYGVDKFMATRRKQRISEKTLHLLALGGGTPGAIASQLIFRHKTRKRKFQLITFTIVALQVAALATYCIYLK